MLPDSGRWTGPWASVRLRGRGSCSPHSKAVSKMMEKWSSSWRQRNSRTTFLTTFSFRVHRAVRIRPISKLWRYASMLKIFDFCLIQRFPSAELNRLSCGMAPKEKILVLKYSHLARALLDFHVFKNLRTRKIPFERMFLPMVRLRVRQ